MAEFTANLLFNMPVNEVWMSISIWCSYEERLGGSLSWTTFDHNPRFCCLRSFLTVHDVTKA